jgi:transposase
MAGEDIIMLRHKELKRLHVLKKVLDGELSKSEACEFLSVSERHVRRLLKRISEYGDVGIKHKSRGRMSIRRILKECKERVLELYKEKYIGFGPTHFGEKLHETEGIDVSKETLRKWLKVEGFWHQVRKSRRYRQWRQRKEHRGEMLQLDGRQRDWFEGRGSKCVLMGYIDDASGEVYGRFYMYEGTIPAMDSFKRYIEKYGIPLSVYMDKHTTYKSSARPTIEDELNNVEPLSEFGRALRELGVQRIHANSPQAKGRVERLFRTLQDRLIKEMRLIGISTIEAANKFLEEYLPAYNKQFAGRESKEDDFHRPLPQDLKLDGVLCIKTERLLRNDFTLSYNKKLYQIQSQTTAQRVIVEERLDGSLVMTYQGAILTYEEIMQRPMVHKAHKVRTEKTAYIPPAEHPWRRSGTHKSKNNGLRV